MAKITITRTLFLFIVFAWTILGLSCKKKKEFKNEDGQSAVDVRTAQGENETAIVDINTALSEQALTRGKSSEYNSEQGVFPAICGMWLDTTQVFSGILKLNYNGSVCNGRKREGQIVVTIINYPVKKWKNAGCTAKIEFKDYKVTRLSDGKSFQIDGKEYLTNIGGGTWYDMYFLGQASLIHNLNADSLKVKFNGESTAIFNLRRRYTFSYKNKLVFGKVEGFGEVNGLSNVENWGQNRDGVNFTSHLTRPVLWNSSCGATAPYEGEVKIKVDEKAHELNCLFGVDSEGNSVSIESGCPFGWQLSWTYKNKTNKRVFSYN